MVTVKPGGAKNISLALLALPILTDNQILFNNVPDIIDTNYQHKLNLDLGITGKRTKNGILYHNTGITTYVLNELIGSQIRSSLYYLGALLHVYGEAVIPFPGGCKGTERSYDMHISSMRYLGAEINFLTNAIHAKRCNMKGDRLLLPIPSKGTTINLIYCATGLEGKTIIENASVVPEIRHLVKVLQLIGFDISIVQNTIIIYGKSNRGKCNIVEYNIPYDRIEVGTFAILSLLTGLPLTIDGFNPDDMGDVLYLLNKLNANYKITDSQLILPKMQHLKPIEIETGFPPAIDSDLGPILVPLLCLIKGKSIIHEGNNLHRIGGVLDQLAQLHVNYHRISPSTFEIDGVSRIYGDANLYGEEIRGTVGLLLASLVATGNIKVTGTRHIRRAYENFEKKLSDLGFSINLDDYIDDEMFTILS